jgi:hypothetical protein
MLQSRRFSSFKHNDIRHKSIPQQKSEGKKSFNIKLWLYAILSYGKINGAEGMSPNLVGCVWQREAAELN